MKKGSFTVLLIACSPVFFCLAFKNEENSKIKRYKDRVQSLITFLTLLRNMLLICVMLYFGKHNIMTGH